MRAAAAILSNGIKDLHPAYFAVVMATGIISISFRALGFIGISESLFVLNLAFYLVLFVLLAARVLFFRPNVMADLRTPRRAWPFLTFVVGTNTLGAQLVLFRQAAGPAALLWVVALISWFLCVYFILFNLSTMMEKPVEEVVDGATLLVIVGTESVALLGVRLLDSLSIHAAPAYFAVWAFWASGFVLYLLLAPLVICRLFLRRLEPKDWTGPYWVCMGAAAIITLAGSELVLHMPAGPLWTGIRAATLTVTLFAWVIATWWIPYLLLMDVWKFTRIGIRAAAPRWIKLFPWARLAFGGEHHFFEPPEWGRVFPMGMYTACALSLAKSTSFGFLNVIPASWGWLALLAWALTMAGTLRSVIVPWLRWRGRSGEDRN